MTATDLRFEKKQHEQQPFDHCISSSTYVVKYGLSTRMMLLLKSHICVSAHSVGSASDSASEGDRLARVRDASGLPLLCNRVT